jgi:DNA-binding PadR family transcriptional regulator
MGTRPWDWFNDSSNWNAWFYTPLKRGRFFGAGELRLAILSLLSESPKHGYELMKELEARSGGSYRVSAGTMYPTLQQLEDEGMVTSEQMEGKRVYRLTELGQQELEREAKTVEDIWRKASHWGDWAPWIAGPFGALAKSAFQATRRSGADAVKRAEIEKILDRARRELDAIE